MSDTEIIIKNSSYLIISDIIRKILEVGYILFLAKFLGVEGFGIITYWLSFETVIAFTTDLGSNRLLIRNVAREKKLANRYLVNTGLLKFFLSIVVSLILIIILETSISQSTLKVSGYFMISSLIMKSIYFYLIFPMFRAYEKMIYQAIGVFMNSLLKFSLLFLGHFLNFSVIGFSSLHFVSALITLVYSLIIFVVKFFIPKFTFDFGFVIKIIKESIPFGLSAAFLGSYDWIESNTILIFYGEFFVGVYNGAYKLIQPIITLSMIISFAVFPALSRYYKNSLKNYKNLFRKYLKIIFLLSIPISIIISFYSDLIINIVYKESYSASIPLLRALSWVIVIVFVRSAFVKLFESSNRQKLLSYITGACMLINILLNLLFVRFFGVEGAAIARIVTTSINVLVFIIYLYYKRFITQLKTSIITLTKITTCAGIMTFILYILKLALKLKIEILNASISIIIAIIVYLISLKLFRVPDSLLDNAFKYMKKVKLRKKPSKIN